LDQSPPDKTVRFLFLTISPLEARRFLVGAVGHSGRTSPVSGDEQMKEKSLKQGYETGIHFY